MTPEEFAAMKKEYSDESCISRVSNSTFVQDGKLHNDKMVLPNVTYARCICYTEVPGTEGERGIQFVSVTASSCQVILTLTLTIVITLTPTKHVSPREKQCKLASKDQGASLQHKRF